MARLHTAYVLLGTNQGNRLNNLKTAAMHLASLAVIEKTSSVYETEPWGKVDQPLFYNQVVKLKTDLSPSDLLTAILKIENVMGRVRLEKWGERIIDLDILLYEDQIVNEPGLTIPHPGLPSRRFALAPLNEISPDQIHPDLNITISRLLVECEDTLEVRKISG